MSDLSIAILLITGVALVIGLIVFESRRQARRLGEKATGRPNALGNALLEAHGLLEPERKVEIIQQELRGEERVQVEHDQEAGDDPERLESE